MHMYNHVSVKSVYYTKLISLNYGYNMLHSSTLISKLKLSFSGILLAVTVCHGPHSLVSHMHPIAPYCTHIPHREVMRSLRYAPWVLAATHGVSIVASPVALPSPRAARRSPAAKPRRALQISWSKAPAAPLPSG